MRKKWLSDKADKTVPNWCDLDNCLLFNESNILNKRENTIIDIFTNVFDQGKIKDFPKKLFKRKSTINFSISKKISRNLICKLDDEILINYLHILYRNMLRGSIELFTNDFIKIYLENNSLNSKSMLILIKIFFNIIGNSKNKNFSHEICDLVKTLIKDNSKIFGLSELFIITLNNCGLKFFHKRKTISQQRWYRLSLILNIYSTWFKNKTVCEELHNVYEFSSDLIILLMDSKCYFKIGTNLIDCIKSTINYMCRLNIDNYEFIFERIIVKYPKYTITFIERLPEYLMDFKFAFIKFIAPNFIDIFKLIVLESLSRANFLNLLLDYAQHNCNDESRFPEFYIVIYFMRHIIGHYENPNLIHEIKKLFYRIEIKQNVYIHEIKNNIIYMISLLEFTKGKTIFI